MDEWQVGDPPDWGDSVGVPDIPYMGYINDGEDDEDDPPYEVTGGRSRDEELADEAFSLQEEERYEEALSLVERALEINPNKIRHWNLKAIIIDNSGRHEEALQYYDRALDIYRDEVVLDNKAQCLYRIAEFKKYSDDYEGALDYVNKALATVVCDDDRKRYLYLKGDILQVLGHQVQSKKCFLLAAGRIDKIRELEDKVNQIRNSTSPLINISATKFYKGTQPFRPGVVVDLVKEPENEHDRNAIRVEIDGETVGYVGNSSNTVPDGVKSATEIQDKFDSNLKAEVMFFYLDWYIIARLI